MSARVRSRLEAGGDDRAGRVTIGPSLALVATALVAGVVVAIASDGLRLVPPARDLGARWTWWVRMVGIVSVAAGAAGLLAFRRRARAEGGGGADPTVVGVRTAATTMGLLTVLALTFGPSGPAPDSAGLERPAAPLEWHDWGGADGGRGVEPPTPARGGNSLIEGSGIERGGDELPSISAPPDAIGPSLRERVVRGLGVLLLLAVAVLLVRRLRGRHASPATLAVDEPVAAGEVEEALERSLDEVVRSGSDPRGRITAAYHRLLETLAGAGAPRASHEAPHEHLERALGPLGVRLEALHRLAALYVAAQFSERPMTERDRAAAAEALGLSLRDLRTAGLRTGE